MKGHLLVERGGACLGLHVRTRVKELFDVPQV